MGVLVRLGDLASNMDFPPWQLRLTEMFSIPSLRNVSPDKLIGVLRQYGKCEQCMRHCIHGQSSYIFVLLFCCWGCY